MSSNKIEKIANAILLSMYTVSMVEVIAASKETLLDINNDALETKDESP
ncbi:MAG: hypothetical protein ACW98Y_08385 [Candidatus Thorarchaeota archaeon]|jgi:hypothetical protein